MSKKDSVNTSKSIEENRLYHTRYLRAIKSPVRREILRALKKVARPLKIFNRALG